MQELLQTEEAYVKDLRLIVEVSEVLFRLFAFADRTIHAQFFLILLSGCSLVFVFFAAVSAQVCL